jgi:predicted RNA binding protein YcfA (HicA-like mRNA interferase family)
VPKLPVISGKEAGRAFEKDGWTFVRLARDRHRVYRKQGRIMALSIPEHKVLDRGLLRSLIRDAGITVERFIGLLEED